MINNVVVGGGAVGVPFLQEKLIQIRVNCSVTIFIFTIR
jgi:hypothetical protein